MLKKEAITQRIWSQEQESENTDICDGEVHLQITLMDKHSRKHESKEKTWGLLSSNLILIVESCSFMYLPLKSQVLDKTRWASGLVLSDNA